MNDISDCIIKALADNGVSVELENVWENNSLGARIVKRIVSLDFSEHDKAFENEIAGLKAKIAIKDMDYKTASELLGKYQRENEALKKRIDELEKELSSVVKEAERKEFIREMSCLEIQELKQRIAELESEETGKPTKYTTVIVAKEINGQEYVRLEDFMSVVNDLQAKIGT